MARLLPIAFVLAGAVAFAADLDRAEEAEDRALDAQAQGDLPGMQAAWQEAIEALVAARTERNGAEVDSFLSYAIDRFSEAALQGGSLAAGADFLAGLAIPDDAPLLAARRDWDLATLLLRLGRLDEARRRTDGLGFLGEWLVCGPFDNQEGQGLAHEDGPEGPFHADATFHGKGKSVAWRSLPVPLCLGTVDFDCLFRPNDQACAYATTWIRMESPTPAVARVASDEGFRLWLDGRLVVERDVRRDAGIDQDAVPLPLGAGWHRLVVKVGDITGAWGFRLRLTDREGRVVRPAETCVDPAKAASLAAGDALAWTGARPAEDLDWLRARAKSGKASSRERYHLGLLLGARRLQPRDRRDDRAELQAAASKAPKNPHYAYALALSFRESTSMAAEAEENEVRSRLEVLLAKSPEYDSASLELARIEAKTLARGRDASDRTRAVVARHPRNLAARLLEIDLLAARNLASLARKRVDDLARDFPDQPAALSKQVDALLSDGRVADARPVLDRALALDPMDDGLRNAAIRSLRAQGDLAGVLALCAQAIEASPLALDARSVRIGTLDAAGRLEEALAECDQALAICPENAQLHEGRARVLDRLGRRDEAIAAWKLALAADPNDARLRRLLEYLSTDQESYEARYRVPFEQAVEAGRKAAKDPSAHARYLLDELVVRLHPDGTKGQYTHWIVEMLDEKAIREFDTMSIRYSAGEEAVKVLTARVVHPDGRVDEARLPAPPETEGNGEGRALALDLPPLAIGDIVDLEYRTEDVRQGFFGDYFGIRFFFASEYPLVRSRIVLLFPVDRKLHVHARNGGPEATVGEGRTKDEACRTWEIHDAARIQAEPGMPALDEVVPTVEVASFAGWKEFGAWYWSMVKGQWDSAPEVRAKALALTKGIDDPEGKVRAVYDFVSQKVPYQAWEFGVHGFQPYRASQILKRGFGDCKDKATLICVMLGEIGIRARPVLIHANEPHGKDDLASPLMEHFNHCIALATLPDGREVFLDGTAQLHPMEVLPAMDHGATVLVVEEDGGRTTDVPWGKAEENRRTKRVKVTIAADGSAEAEVTSEPTGLPAVTDRATYEAENRRTEAIEQEWSRRFGACKVVDEEFGDLTDVDAPVKIRYRIKVPSFARRRGDGLAIPASPFPLGLASSAALLARTHDLLLAPPCSDEAEVRFVLPAGVRPGALPAPLEIDTPVASAKASYAIDGGDLVLTRSVAVKVSRVGPGDYAAYRGLVQALDRWEAQDVVLEKVEK